MDNDNNTKTKWAIFYDDANLGSRTSSEYVWLSGYIFSNLNDVKNFLMQHFQFNPKTKKNELININDTPSAIVDNRFVKYQLMYGSDYQFNYNTLQQKSTIEFEKNNIYINWLLKNNKIQFYHDNDVNDDDDDDIIKREEVINSNDDTNYNNWFNLKGYKKITNKLFITQKPDPEELLIQLKQKEKIIDETLHFLEYGILKETPFYLNYDANQLFICRFFDSHYQVKQKFKKFVQKIDKNTQDLYENHWATIFVPKKFLNQLFNMNDDDDLS